MDENDDILYSLDFLAQGNLFPPPSQWARLQTYSDNTKLFKQQVAEVLEPYSQRIREITSRFANIDWENYTGRFYEMELDYFQLISLKTMDLVCGENPTVSSKPKRTPPSVEPTPDTELEAMDEAAQKIAQETAELAWKDNLDEITNDTKLFKKLQSAVLGLSYCGDAIARIYKDGKKNNCTITSPAMWFPVVDREVKENILYHVLAWVECTTPNEQDEKKKVYILRVQIHEKGRYTNYTYACKPEKAVNNVIGPHNLNVSVPTFKIGGLLEEEKPVNTGLSDFAIVHLSNVVPPDTIFGINDYDRIVPILAELNVRYTLESFVLDKHSAPTMALPESAFFQNRLGEWVPAVGGAVKTKNGEPLPSYITWDAAMTANHAIIEKLEKHLYSLSEMGAVINDDSFGASQGYEALETRMTNAKLKARRIAQNLTDPLKKIIALLSEVGYTRIDESELSVQWNEGLPTNEYRETDIATKKVGNKAIFDVATVLQEHFGKTKEEAEAIADKIGESEAMGFAGQYAALMTGEHTPDNSSEVKENGPQGGADGEETGEEDGDDV